MKLLMSKRKILLGSGIIAAFALIALSLPLYAANQNADYGRSVEFVPFVRHMMSQLHCYDTGTNECEKTSHLGTSFTKEHTMGFLLDGSRHRLSQFGFEPVYVCEGRHNSGVMMVTAGTVDDNPRQECRDAGFRPAKRVGYISSTDQIEAPWALYRCVEPTTHDTLLTHNTAECTTASYGAAELLGYLYAGGPLPLQ